MGVDDLMAQVLWTRHFLMSQGYPIDDNVVYQDNQSTILLAKNGRGSSGKRTRHINYVWNTALPETWWRISSPSRCRDHCSASYET